jgi:hypothetical protein
MGSAMPAWVQMALAVASWGLVVGAWVLIAVWARGKRGAGARWCAKCLYDMTGLPGMRCPECGREAKSEKQLRRRKRRWGALAAALVLFVLNYAMWVPVRLQHEGWKTALVPTGALVLGLPWVAQNRRGTTSEVPGVPAAEISMPFWDAAYDLLVERIDREDLSVWHREAVGQFGLRQDLRNFDPTHLRRWGVAHRGVRQLLEHGIHREAFREGLTQRIEGWSRLVITTRDVWPQGALVHVVVEANAWGSDKLVLELCDANGKRIEGAMIVYGAPSAYVRFDGVPPPGERRRYVLRLRRDSRYGGDASLLTQRDFEIIGAKDDLLQFLEAVPLPIESLLARASVDLENDGFDGSEDSHSRTTRSWVEFPAQREPLQLEPRYDVLGEERLTLGVWVDVYCGEELYCRGSAVFSVRSVGENELARPGGKWVGGLQLDPIHSRPMTTDGPWRVVLTGDPHLALMDFECKRYWEGQTTIELPFGRDEHGER